MFSKRRFRRNKPRTQNLLEGGEQQKETPFILPIQNKLNIGKPGDAYEVEADKTADEVLNRTATPDSVQKMGSEEEELQAKPLAQGLTPFVQKQSEAEEEEESVQAQVEKEDEESLQPQKEEEDPVQTKSQDQIRNTNGLSAQLNSTKGGGSEMDKATKTEMEQAFGNDFSNVNIHTDAKAVALNKSLYAQAFTHGNNIYFNNGKYNPKTKKGKHLLAHELTHTIQQKGKSRSVQKKDNENEPTTPGALIEKYTNFGGFNLQEIELASDLRSRVLEDTAQFNFVIETLVMLDESNMHQVSYSMVLHMDDANILSLANTSKGYDFLINVLQTLKDESQIRKINKWLPSENELRNIKTEEDRIEVQELLKKAKPNAKEASFFREDPSDTTESVLKITGTSRNDLIDHISFGINDLSDIEKNLSSHSKANENAVEFISVLHFMGHGTAQGDERTFFFGSFRYPLETIKTYQTGLYEKFIMNGGSILMEGCEVAKGEKGKEYLGEIARITFGESKWGFIKGNQCIAGAGPGSVVECDPVTYKWPNDFN